MQRQSLKFFVSIYLLITFLAFTVVTWIIQSDLPEKIISIVIVELVFFWILFLFARRFYRSISYSIKEMQNWTDRVTNGSSGKSLPSYQVLELNQLASSMNKMGTQLNQLDRIRKDFVANVSHELKTPITSIKGFVETLLDGAILNLEDAKRFLAIIAKQADRMIAIIDDLLTLARLESEGADHLLVWQTELVEELLSSISDTCRERAEVKKIQIEFECEKGLTAVVDRSLLEQAIINLVDNAVKYSEEKSKVRLISKTNERGDLVIYVIDQGPGIAADHLPRIFERFYRVDKARSRQVGGTGLGLSIVKHVAQVHSGTVSVMSEVGKGSTFIICLPQLQNR